MDANLDLAVSVSRETLEKLDAYVALLKKWNPAINLVSRSTLEDVWTRHIQDSAQVFAVAPPKKGHWVDLGSGGGFPGMVCAILGGEVAPGLRFTMIESDQRKATFLRTVARETGVHVDVLARRVEEVDHLGADVLSARALAPLTDLLGFAERHLAPTGVALFPKGATHEKEIAELLDAWRFTYQKHSSATDASSVILEIGEIARA